MNTGILIFLIAVGVIVVPGILWTLHAIRKQNTQTVRVQHRVRSRHGQRNFYFRRGPIRYGRQRVSEWELPPGTVPLRPSQLPLARATLSRYERRIRPYPGVREEIIMEDDARAGEVEAVLPEARPGELPGGRGPTPARAPGSQNDDNQPEA